MWSSSVSRISQAVQSSTSRSAVFASKYWRQTPPAVSLLGRTYISRAHPRTTPEVAVNEAMTRVLDDVKRRRRRRARKWKRNAPQRQAQGITDAKVSHPDETIELALNLNLDPRKPGQSLRGSISLPHGTGKKVDCIVFTDGEDLQAAALKAGAMHAGGESLIDEILNGQVPVDSFQRALATSDMMPILSKKIARLLGPRGLMPNAKVGTLVPAESMMEALSTQLGGKDLQYRTEKEGIVHVPVGKASFNSRKLLDNIGEVMKMIFEVKPESYGKGKKKGATGKAAKYLLRASLSSTQGPGFRIDLRTVDPTSAFFLTSVDDVGEKQEEKQEVKQ